MVRYQSQRAPNTELRGRLRELANGSAVGYRRLFVLLRREGEPSGINRIYRPYREEGLSVFNVADDVTRECMAAIPDTSISGRRVARELTAPIERHGRPGMIVSDNGTDLT